MLRKLINEGGSLYTLKFFFLRLIFTSTIGIVSSLVIFCSIFGFENLKLIDRTFYTHIIIIYFFISEGVVLIHYYLNKKYPSIDDFFKRFGRQIVFSIIWFLIVFLTAFLQNKSQIENKEHAISIFILFLSFGALFVYILTLDLLSAKIVLGYKDAIKRIENLKRDKLKLAYQSLQDQINPHFLFNNLTVLISEIKYNQDNAVKFTEKLADVYRYVLASKDKMVIKLEEEVNFAKAFIFLHQTRLGDGLKIITHEEKILKDMQIPPLSIQTLIENAIKHNITDIKKPLTIEIYPEGDKVCVKNNLQPKTTTYSTNTGLKNLIKRYSLLGNYEVQILKEEDYFLVKIPIIKSYSC